MQHRRVGDRHQRAAKMIAGAVPRQVELRPCRRPRPGTPTIANGSQPVARPPSRAAATPPPPRVGRALAGSRAPRPPDQRLRQRQMLVRSRVDQRHARTAVDDEQRRCQNVAVGHVLVEREQADRGERDRRALRRTRTRGTGGSSACPAAGRASRRTNGMRGIVPAGARRGRLNGGRAPSARLRRFGFAESCPSRPAARAGWAPCPSRAC